MINTTGRQKKGLGGYIWHEVEHLGDDEITDEHVSQVERITAIEFMVPANPYTDSEFDICVSNLMVYIGD